MGMATVQNAAQLLALSMSVYAKWCPSQHTVLSLISVLLRDLWLVTRSSRYTPLGHMHRERWEPMHHPPTCVMLRSWFSLKLEHLLSTAGVGDGMSTWRWVTGLRSWWAVHDSKATCVLKLFASRIGVQFCVVWLKDMLVERYVARTSCGTGSRCKEVLYTLTLGRGTRSSSRQPQPRKNRLSYSLDRRGRRWYVYTIFFINPDNLRWGIEENKKTVSDLKFGRN